MDLAAVGKLFLEAENKTDVARFEILGIRIWPILRILLMVSINDSRYANSPQDEATEGRILAEMARQVSYGRRPSDAHDATHLPAIERLRREYVHPSLWIPRLLARRVQRFLPHRFWRVFAPEPKGFATIKAAADAREKYAATSKDAGQDIKSAIQQTFGGNAPDFLLFTSEGAHYHALGDKNLSPIADAWIETLSNFGTVQKVLARPSKRELYFSGVHFENTESDKVFQNFYVSGINIALYPDFPISQFERLVQLRNDMRRIHKIFDFSVPKLMNHLRGVQKAAYFYDLIFKELSPKFVFFVSFSGYIPAIHAANKLGIPTIDLQHGGTPQNHVYLSHYERVPSDGYLSLPTMFWCWNEETCDGLNRWWTGTPRHSAKRVGNPWWSEQSRHFQEQDLTRPQRDLLEHAKSCRSVLVSLVRPPDDVPPEFLLNAIKEAPADLLWNIRLHPLDRQNLEAMNQVFGELSERVNLVEATEVPLPLILDVTDVHLTGYSTTWKEAASLGIPTGFWHQSAVSSFGSGLGWKKNALCTDAASLSQFLETSKRVEAPDEFSTTLDMQAIGTLLKSEA